MYIQNKILHEKISNIHQNQTSSICSLSFNREVFTKEREQIEEKPSKYILIQDYITKVLTNKEYSFLLKIHGWLKYNERNNKNLYKNRYWTKNSLKKWSKEMGKGYSTSTLKRIIASLKEKKILLTTREFNKNPLDRTCWYSINYKTLLSLILTQEGKKIQATSRNFEPIEKSRKKQKLQEKEGANNIYNNERYIINIRENKIQSTKNEYHKALLEDILTELKQYNVTEMELYTITKYLVKDFEKTKDIFKMTKDKNFKKNVKYKGAYIIKLLSITDKDKHINDLKYINTNKEQPKKVEELKIREIDTSEEHKKLIKNMKDNVISCYCKIQELLSKYGIAKKVENAILNIVVKIENQAQHILNILMTPYFALKVKFKTAYLLTILQKSKSIDFEKIYNKLNNINPFINKRKNKTNNDSGIYTRDISEYEGLEELFKKYVRKNNIDDSIDNIHIQNSNKIDNNKEAEGYNNNNVLSSINALIKNFEI